MQSENAMITPEWAWSSDTNVSHGCLHQTAQSNLLQLTFPDHYREPLKATSLRSLLPIDVVNSPVQ